MNLTVDVDRVDARWCARIVDLPGVRADGTTRTEATARCIAAALRVLALRVEQSEDDFLVLSIMPSRMVLPETEARRITRDVLQSGDGQDNAVTHR